MGYSIGIDTGGTFTDCVIVRAGQVFYDKAPSTPRDFAQGVLDSLAATAGTIDQVPGAILQDTEVFAHGTTAGLNKLFTRSGGKVGLITTRGHEDSILIGRVEQKVAGLGEREIIHAVRLDKARPIVPRPMIKGINERVDWKGNVLVQLNEAEVRDAVAALLREGVEGIAVSFLWSFMNPAHERRVAAIIESMAPGLFVTLSCDLVPVIGEYERTATTVINSYLGPTVSQYVNSLAIRLKDQGLTHPLLLMQSTGGVLPAKEAAGQAVNVLSSGPVGGVIASRVIGERLGFRNVITTDVGGTSFDVGLIIDGQPQVARAPVFTQYRVLTNMVDITSIGAGGGSIASVEKDTRTLSVGPHSAGALPGPACYGLGGENPTVTDADLVLGRIDPDFFFGGRLRLDRAKAEAAICTKVADPLGMDLVTAARGITEIIDAHMADLVRKVTIERGHDPRDFVLFAFGGGGPTHGGAYGPQVGVPRVIFSPYAAVFSALGIAMSDVVRFYSKSEPMQLPWDANRISEIYAELEARARADLAMSRTPSEAAHFDRAVDMRFRYQIHEIRVPMPAGELTAADMEQLGERFRAIYEHTYGAGTAYARAGMELITFRLTSTTPIPKPSLMTLPAASGPASQAVKGERSAYFDGGFVATPVYAWDQLKAGHQFAGPGLVEGPATTVVVHPNQLVSVDQYSNLILEG